MPTAPATSVEAILAAQDWADLSRRLTRYVHVRLRKASWETAEDIAQEAIEHFLDPAYAPWDRDATPDVFDALGSVANGLVANHARKAKRHGKHVSLRDDDRTHDDEEAELPQEDRPGDDDEKPTAADAVVVADSRTAESYLLFHAEERDAKRDALALKRLRARLHGDTVCLAILKRMKSGEDRPADHAAALGIDVAEVYNAKRRIHHHVRALAREIASGGES